MKDMLEDVSIAQSAADLASPAELASMTGLQFLQSLIDGDRPAPPINRALNFRLDEVSEGRAVFRGKALFGAYNPIGTVHGGWFGTLLDSCMSCAVQTTLPAGKGYTTLEYKVSLIRPVFETTGEILAIGELRHAGRRTGVADGRLVGAEDGKLYATGSTTCLIMDLG